MADRSFKDRPTGALLVEALVSFALFLVASVALFGLLAHSRRAEAKAGQILAANAYARQLMESRRVKGYAALTAGVESGTRNVARNRSGAAGSTRITHHVAVYEGPGTGVRSIVVTVAWHAGQVTLESYVTAQ